MSSIYRVPLNPFAEQFQIEINGTNYLIRTHWNEAIKRWTIDLGTSGEHWLICNMAMVAGVDLLAQHAHLGLGFKMLVQVDGDSAADVGAEGFGDGSELFVVIEDA